MTAERGGSSAEGPMRREQRFELRLDVSLRTDAGSYPACLLDLSRAGAMVETRLPLLAGARVTLIAERLEVEARLVWARNGRCGLLFDKELKATDIFFQVGRSRDAARAQGPGANR